MLIRSLLKDVPEVTVKSNSRNLIGNGSVLLEEYKNDIRIELNMTPLGENYSSFTVFLSAVEITEKWIPDLLYIEKVPRYFMPDDPPYTGSEPLWDYIVNLQKVNSEDSKTKKDIRIIFRHQLLATSFLKSLHKMQTIDFKSLHPEIFL
jgi:hypothetical protein